VPVEPTPEQLRAILVDMAYDLHLVPDGDAVPAQFLEVLRRQYFAAVEAGGNHAAAPAEAGNAIEDRNVWKRVVPPEEVGAEPDAERVLMVRWNEHFTWLEATDGEKAGERRQGYEYRWFTPGEKA
jgi:hypothetical protein